MLDLGGVLVDWNPRHLYRQLIPEDEEMELFLSEVCTPEWNLQLDAGRPIGEAVAALCSEHPSQSHLIQAWQQRWIEMVAGPIPGMAELLADVVHAGYRCYLLSNCSAETWPAVLSAYPFLRQLHGVVVSGEVRRTKPDPELFVLACARFGLRPEQALFVDDLAPNVEGARRAGLRALQFSGAAALRAELAASGWAVPARPGGEPPDPPDQSSGARSGQHRGGQDSQWR